MIFLNKFLLLTLTAGITVGSLCGCAGKKSGGDVPATTAPTASENSSAVVTTALQITTSPESQPEMRDIKPAAGTYVYDNANVLDTQSFSACNDYTGWLYEEYLINAAVVTASDLGGKTSYEYAAETYEKLYSGRGSGLLLLIDNVSGSDILYKTGSCARYILDSDQNEVFYWATKDIVEGKYKEAVLSLMKLGEKCPEHIFDNGGIFTNEEVGELERLITSGKNKLSLLATSNSTDKTNEDVLRNYYERHYKDGDGIMLMLDTEHRSIIAHSAGQLPSGADAALKKAGESASKGDYISAVKTAIEAMKG